MDKTSDLMKKYLSALKERSGMSLSDVCEATGLPDSTVRKIFSGETADPRLETISLIVSSMGGSMDALLSGNITKQGFLDKDEPSDLREDYEKRIEENIEYYKAYIKSLKRDKTLLFVLACSLIGFLAIFLMLDFLLGSAGWIRY